MRADKVGRAADCGPLQQDCIPAVEDEPRSQKGSGP